MTMLKERLVSRSIGKIFVRTEKLKSKFLNFNDDKYFLKLCIQELRDHILE